MDHRFRQLYSRLLSGQGLLRAHHPSWTQRVSPLVPHKSGVAPGVSRLPVDGASTSTGGGTEGNIGKKLKVVVEYSSPNIAKPFHVGHLRSTIIGQLFSSKIQELAKIRVVAGGQNVWSRDRPLAIRRFDTRPTVLTNTLRLAGHDVVALNWLGDWGTQFGILAHALRTLGHHDGQAVARMSLMDLYEVYVGASARAEKDDAFRNAGVALAGRLQLDPAVWGMWGEMKRVSEAEFARLYDRLGVEFTSVDSESQYVDRAEQLMREWLGSGLLEKSSNGAVGIPTSKLSLGPEADYRAQFITLTRPDGSTVYLTRDLAAILDRYERYGFDRILYVVGSEQAGHMKLIEAILRAAGHAHIADRLTHVGFRKVAGMSSRAGNAVFVHELLARGEAEAEAYLRGRKNPKITPENRRQIVQAMALGAWTVRDLSHPRLVKYRFNWKHALRQASVDQEPSIFRLQYCYARICSLIDKARATGIDIDPLMDDVQRSTSGSQGGEEFLHILLNESEVTRDCLTSLAKLSEAPSLILASLDPHDFLVALFDAIGYVNSAYNKCSVAKADSAESARARLSLFILARALIEESCRLLNITPLREI